MDFGSLGVNTGLVAGIVAVTQLLKKLDKESKFKKYYILIPLILGIGASFLITDPLTIKDVIINSIIYAGVSGYFYKSGKLALEKGKNVTKKTNDSKGKGEG
jgi:Ca2+/Na+ antiporter